MITGYYPGCSLTGTSKEYDISLRETLSALGVELREIDDWSCCGASSAHSHSHLLSLALPARNLQLASEQGMEEVLAPCAACFNRLAVAAREIEAKPELKRKIEYVLEKPYRDGVRVRSIIDMFESIGADEIASRTVLPLKGMKFACYYGCLLLRPETLPCGDDREQPRSMERLLEAAGASTVEWNFKTECCGASHSIARMDIVLDLSKMILDDARDHGADAVVVACPMCHSNLDMRQRTIRKRDAAHKDMPVLYLSELLGLAMGIDRAKLGLGLHFIDASPLLAKVRKEENPA